MNDFSLICRMLGSLFYRQPQDPLLMPLFTLLHQGELQRSWPLEQDELLSQLQQHSDPQSLSLDYNSLFVGDACQISPYGSHWAKGPEEKTLRDFLALQGMPLTDAPADHIGQILLAASWLEDSTKERGSTLLRTLFNDYLTPWCGLFLADVNARASAPFYRTLATLTQEAIQIMSEELNEDNGSQ